MTYVVNRNLGTAAVAGSDPASRERLAALAAGAAGLGATEICLQGPLPASADDEAERTIGARQRRRPDIGLLRQRALDHLAAPARDPGPRRLLAPATRSAASRSCSPATTMPPCSPATSGSSRPR